MTQADEPPSDEALREQCIRLLARREHSRRELSRKLAARSFEASQFNPILDELEAEGLLSDERFAESFVRSRLENGQGPLKIRAELSERGVTGVIVDQALDLEDDEWLSHCERAWARRFGQAPEDRREWARQARFLTNRGFSGDIVARVLARIGEGNE